MSFSNTALLLKVTYFGATEDMRNSSFPEQVFLRKAKRAAQESTGEWVSTGGCWPSPGPM